MGRITKIVITGGPCAGKTTALSWIQNAFTAKGYKVLFVPETASELIGGGLAPWTVIHNVDYQKCQMKLQLEKERIFEQGARHMSDEKLLIVCDRGAIDNRAYMTDSEFAQVLRMVHRDETELRDSYDAVFFLETAAKGKEAFYTLANNVARTETPEQAVELDNRLIAAWTGHPHLRVIGNETDFDQKMHRLISEISAFLGEPLPYDTFKKFLISMPDAEKLENDPSCRKVEIIQTYLRSGPDEKIRVRQRGLNGSYIYFKNTKRPGADGKRIELEQRLSEFEYLRLLMEADTTYHQLRKTRYCFTWDGHYYEVDIYPFWKKQAILKQELTGKDDTVVIPPFITMLEDISEDPAYKNSSIAKQAPAEK